MSVRLSIAVQAHPSRSDIAGALSELLAAEIIYDPQPDSFRSPWRTYRRALELTPADATHRLIVQDDATPCGSFAEVARRAVAACPDSLIAFWQGGVPHRNILPMRRALHAGCPWAELTGGWGRPVVPAVALSWPVEAIGPALAWVDEQRFPEKFVADDEIIGRIAHVLDLTVCATVPSLVEHEDLVESVKSSRASGGRNPARRAAFPLGELDPLTIDWG